MPGAQVASAPRRWPRRLLLGLNIFLVLCILVVGTSYGYIRWRYGQLDKVDLGDVLRGHLGQGEEEDEPGSPLNVLLVGSDSRRNIPKGEQAQFGTRSQVAGQRSDTIMLMHVDPQTKQAAILSIPRDLWVTIPGMRNKQRINIAFEGGSPADGARRLIQTIQQNLEIDIDHYVQVDFNGFRGIVKAIGGVKVYVPAPARDRLAGLSIPRPGCIKLSGDQALAYVRSRHYQTYESGSWRTDPTSDFGRILRQQDFIRRVIRTARGSGIPNPVRLERLVAIGVDNVTVDQSLSSKDMLNLAKNFRSLTADEVEMVTLPTEPMKVGAADVLRLKQPEAQQIIDRFNGVQSDEADEPVLSVIPAEVSVRVLNGSGRGGQAGAIAAELQKRGFGVGFTGDADSFKYIKPVIRYAPGQRDKALLLRSYIQGGAQLRDDPSLRGGDLVLVTGSAFGGVRTPGVSTTTSSSLKPPVSVAPRGAPRQPQC